MLCPAPRFNPGPGLGKNYRFLWIRIRSQIPTQLVFFYSLFNRTIESNGSKHPRTAHCRSINFQRNSVQEHLSHSTPFFLAPRKWTSACCTSSCSIISNPPPQFEIFKRKRRRRWTTAVCFAECIQQIRRLLFPSKKWKESTPWTFRIFEDWNRSLSGTEVDLRESPPAAALLSK